MKRTSLGLFFILAAVAVAACSPEGPAPDQGDSESGDAPSAGDPASAAPLAGTSLQAQRLEADMRAHDEAKAAGAEHPHVKLAISKFSEHHGDHGITADDTFKVRNVHVDDNGDRYVRMDHYYRGLRVVGSTGALRTDRDGATQEERSDGLRKGIAVDTKPRLTEKEAHAVVAARPERGAPLIEPRSELVIFPVKKRFVIATGEPVTGLEEDLNALDVETRVIEYKLAYQIDTFDKGTGAPHASHRFMVDAGSGEVLSVRSLEETVTGNAWMYMTNGPADDFHAPIDTYQHNSTNFEPKDSYRNFGVWDDDFGNNSGPNWDMNNLWGDGAIFAGDANATYQNRQTAIADADYAMQGTWDMFDNVWNRQGYNNSFYAGHAYVHVDTDWDDASYSSLSGNISVGDSTGTRRSIRTSYDTLAHEFGHGLNDFSAGISGGGEPDGLSEANSDIIGEISEAYEVGLGLQNSSLTIPSSPGPDWYGKSSGRNFKTANGYRYWTSGLADYPDEHTRALPMDHAFYFLSQGSSSNPISTMWSTYVPWGMTGVGIDHAARIWIRALLTGFNGNQDYADARSSCLTAASQLYGSGSAEYKAVQNAFAAIGVGSVASGYPGSPVTQNEAESNNNELAANNVSSGTLPSGTPVTGTLYKRTVIYGATSTSDVYDWFSIGIPSGKHLRVTLIPYNDTDISLYDGFDTLIDSSANSGTTWEQVTATAPSDGMVHPYSIRLNHWTTAVGQFDFYQMYVDIW